MKPGALERDRRPHERVVKLVLVFFLLLSAFAPLRAEVVYPPVVPGVELQFPQNEGAHPDYRIEWWYVTGWVQDEDGAPLGFQVTFFRVRPGLGESNPSRFAPTQILFGHAAVADPALGRLRHAERSARAGFDLAYAREGGVDLRLDDWSLRQDGDRYRAVVAGEDFALRLDLDRLQPPLLQGERGYSRKGPSPAQASYYYSLPQLRVSGEIVLDAYGRPLVYISRVLPGMRAYCNPIGGGGMDEARRYRMDRQGRRETGSLNSDLRSTAAAVSAVNRGSCG